MRAIVGNSAYSPTVVMADAAKSITIGLIYFFSKNLFQYLSFYYLAKNIVWPISKRASCFFHLKQNEKSKFKTARLSLFWPLISSEIDMLAQV
jgi:hypothetical protein